MNRFSSYEYTFPKRTDLASAIAFVRGVAMCNVLTILMTCFAFGGVDRYISALPGIFVDVLVN